MARLQASKEIGRGVNVTDASLALVESIPAYDDDNYILDGEGNRVKRNGYSFVKADRPAPVNIAGRCCNDTFDSVLV